MKKSSIHMLQRSGSKKRVKKDRRETPTPKVKGKSSRSNGATSYANIGLSGTAVSGSGRVYVPRPKSFPKKGIHLKREGLVALPSEPFNEQTSALLLDAARHAFRIKSLTARERVLAFLKEQRERGEEVYQIALELGNEAGETLDELIHQERWAHALQIIRRVKTTSF